MAADEFRHRLVWAKTRASGQAKHQEMDAAGAVA